MVLLRLTHLDVLYLLPECKLRPNPVTVLPTSRIRVNQMRIAASLSINTLVALLSQLVTYELGFIDDCPVPDMSSYAPPPPQVSYQAQHEL